MAANTPASRKQKGRGFQQEIRDAILEYFPALEPDDVRSTSSGASGVDILLSPAARKLFNYSSEAKCQESLNIWAALKQCEENCKPEQNPLLIFRRNRTKTYAVVEFKHLLALIKQLKELEQKPLTG